MKNFAKIVLISSAFALASTSGIVNAAKVDGDVKINVKAKNVEQKAVGLANKNEMSVGAVEGKSTKVGGKVNIKVKAKNIKQKAVGLANKNEMKIGTVSD